MANEEEKVDRFSRAVEKLGVMIERARVDEYTSMLTRPWKFFMVNLGAGIFRGFGIAVGFTLVFALVIYILTMVLSRMIDLPIIGYWAAQFIELVNTYLKEGAKIR